MNITNYFAKSHSNTLSVSKNSNVSILHMLGVFCVMLGHQYPLMGMTGIEVLGHSISTIGVEILFVLSGYLQVQSLQKTSLKKYIKKKIFRIIPDYYLYLLIMTFGIGAIVSTHSLRDYFLSSDTWKFLFQNALFYPNYYLPGVFENSLFNSSVNISIWTLPIEFALHLLLPFIIGGCKFINKKSNGKLAFSVILLLFVTIYFYQLHTGITSSLVIWGTKPLSAIRLTVFFLAGSWIKFMSIEQYITPNSLLICILFLVFGINTYQIYLLPIVIVMATIVFISQPQIWNHDIYIFKTSYGIFLWMWPVQQIVLSYMNFAQHNIYVAFLISSILTIAIATLTTKIRETFLKQ